MALLTFSARNHAALCIFSLLYFFFTPAVSQKIAGPLTLNPGVADGYTLFAPLNSKTTYLIDNCGRVINTWQSEYFPGNTVYLLPNGNLVRTNRIHNPVIDGGGGGGGIEILDWQSNVLWSFVYNDDLVRQHHDIAVLPNGNILVLVWELITAETAIANGRNPDLLVDNVIWSEKIIEVKPILPNSSEIVWQWKAMDHLIQDYDDEKSNFGIVADHPELLNFNYTSGQGIDDWLHLNSIDYNTSLDQILISSPFFNEFWIIDHSTTIEEAASHSGGNSNKGGDLLYRWGNPQTYGKGTGEDILLFGQHHVNWIDDSFLHGGKIILFNNNAGANYSTVDIVGPIRNSNGEYLLVNEIYGPVKQDLVFAMNPPEKLFSRIMSGAEMLPNGNIFINSSLQGKFFEVSPDGKILFEYKSPVTVNGIVGRDFNPPDGSFASDPIFRCIKYPPEYPAFDDKDLKPGEPIEGEPWASCELVTDLTNETEHRIDIYPNPVKDYLSISSRTPQKIFSRIATIQGQKIKENEGANELTIDVSALPNGLYLLFVNDKIYKLLKE